MFRKFLQIFCVGLLVIFIILLPDTPSSQYPVFFGLGIFLVLAILVLGPWWPATGTMKESDAKQQFSNSRRIKAFAQCGLSAMFFWVAWVAYSDPEFRFQRGLGTIQNKFGNEAIVWAFLAVAIFLMYNGVQQFRKNRPNSALNPDAQKRRAG